MKYLLFIFNYEFTIWKEEIKRYPNRVIATLHQPVRFIATLHQSVRVIATLHQPAHVISQLASWQLWDPTSASSLHHSLRDPTSVSSHHHSLCDPTSASSLHHGLSFCVSLGNQVKSNARPRLNMCQNKRVLAWLWTDSNRNVEENLLLPNPPLLTANIPIKRAQ